MQENIPADFSLGISDMAQAYVAGLNSAAKMRMCPVISMAKPFA